MGSMGSQHSLDSVDVAKRRGVITAALGIGLYGGALGVSYGALANASGLSPTQTMVLSLVMFTGGSQFAFLGALHSPWVAAVVSLLLALRNAFYGVRLSTTLRTRPVLRPLTAHLVLDESTAMAIAQPPGKQARFAFYTTGIFMFVFWQLGSILGVFLGQGLDAETFGLDVAAPAAFIALLWPALRTRAMIGVAMGAGILAAALIPVLPAGLPVLSTVAVSVFAGIYFSPSNVKNKSHPEGH